MAGLEIFIYQASLLLLYPVIVLLGYCFLQMVWQVGELLHDAWMMRRHRRPEATTQLRSIQQQPNRPISTSLHSIDADCRQHPLVRRFTQELLDELTQNNPATLQARVDHLIGRFEATLARDLNRVRVLVRLGPCLGLAGTLIPLGPGLMALSAGDLSELASRLVVAFSTTVVGLLIGGVSYVVALSRAQTADDLAGDLQLIAESAVALTLAHPDASTAADTQPSAPNLALQS